MAEEDFRQCEQAFRSAGFTLDASRYHKQQMGTWVIELSREGLPRQRVVWDGRDRWLTVEVWASSGSWMDKWVGRKKSEQNAAAAIEQLELPVTCE
jgi:allantoicase